MADKMKMLGQMQGMMANNPLILSKVPSSKEAPGKRLTPKERERMQKERERALRKKEASIAAFRRGRAFPEICFWCPNAKKHDLRHEKPEIILKYKNLEKCRVLLQFRG